MVELNSEVKSIIHKMYVEKGESIDSIFYCLKTKGYAIKKYHIITYIKENKLVKGSILNDGIVQDTIYKMYVLNSCSVKQISELLASRGYSLSTALLTKYIKENKLVKSKNWSDDELAILSRYYPVGGSRLCIDKGINRTVDEIKRKASNMGIKQGKDYKKWEQWELDYILNNYKTTDLDTMAMYLNRSSSSLQNIASKRLKISLRNPQLEWTDSMINLLKEYYPKGGSKLCQEKGLNKESSQIRSKANSIGLVVTDFIWSDKDKEIFKKYYHIGGAKLCQEKGLSKSHNSICSYANRLGITTGKFDDRTYWSDSEVALMKKYYPIGGYKLCQEKGLKRSEISIKQKAKLNGIYYFNMWTDEELAILKKYYPLGGSKLCKNKGLNRTTNQIQQKANTNGIKYVGVK